MEFYCSSCERSFAQVPADVLSTGHCEVCSGQLIAGNAHWDSDTIAGLVALSFDGSAIPIPIIPTLQYAIIDESNPDQSQEAPGDSNETQEEPPTANQDSDIQLESMSSEEEDTDPLTPSLDDLKPIENTAPSNDTPDSSMPSEPSGGNDEQPDPNHIEPTANPADNALPAHLQLPNFPDFDMNFDLGQTQESEEPPESLSDDEQLKALASSVDLDAQTAQDETAGTEQPAQLGPDGLPPPLPPPVQPPPREISPKPTAQSALPALPSLGALPAISGGTQKGAVTLLDDDDAKELAHQLQKRGKTLPLLVGTIVLVGTVLGVGWWQQKTILSLISPNKSIVKTLSDAERANIALAKGVQAYKEKKFDDAIKAYQQALKANARLGTAHRNLAVIYAKRKQQKNAIEHYRAYYRLTPKAADAAKVKVIINDYEKSQKEKSGRDKTQGNHKKRRRP